MGNTVSGGNVYEKYANASRKSSNGGSHVSGASDDVIDVHGVNDLMFYNTSENAKVKEDLALKVIEIAKMMNVDVTGSTVEQKLKSFIDNLPNGKNGKKFNDKPESNKKVCLSVANVINAAFGSDVIDTNRTPEGICKQIHDHLYSLTVEGRKEFLAVAKDVVTVIENLNILQKTVIDVINKMQNSTLANCNDIAKQETKALADYLNALSSESFNQLNILNNLLKLNIKPIDRDLLVLMRNEEGVKTLFDQKRIHTADLIGRVLNGIGANSFRLIQVNEALKKVNLTFNEFKQLPNREKLDSMLLERLRAIKDDAKVFEFIKSMEFLRRVFGRRQEFVKEVTGSGDDHAISYDGGAAHKRRKSKGGVDYDTGDIDYLSRPLNKFERKDRNKAVSRKLYLDSFDRVIKYKLMNIVNDIHAVSDSFDGVVSIDDDIMAFIKALDKFDPTNGDTTLHFMFSGIQNDALTREKRDTYMSLLGNVLSSIDKVLSRTDLAGAKDAIRKLRDDLKEFVDFIQSQSDDMQKRFGSTGVAEYTGSDESRCCGGNEDTEEDTQYDGGADYRGYSIQKWRGRKTWKSAVDKLKYLLKAQQVGQNIKKSATGIKEFSEEYDDKRGIAIADKITALITQRDAAITMINSAFEAHKANSFILQEEYQPTDVVYMINHSWVAAAAPAPIPWTNNILANRLNIAQTNDPNHIDALGFLYPEKMIYYDSLWSPDFTGQFCKDHIDDECPVLSYVETTAAQPSNHKYVTDFGNGLTRRLPRKDAIHGVVSLNILSKLNMAHRDEYVAFIKKYYNSKINMWKTVECIDEYMRVFSDGLLNNLDSANDLIKYFDNLESIQDAYEDKSGDHLQKVFDSFPCQEYPSAVHLPADSIRNGDGHYYKRLETYADTNTTTVVNTVAINSGTRNNDFEHTIYSAGIPQAQYDNIKGNVLIPAFKSVYGKLGDAKAVLRVSFTKTFRAMLADLEQSIKGVKYLKNLLNIFLRVGNKYGGQDLHRKAFLSPIQIYDNMCNYMIYSSLVLTPSVVPNASAIAWKYKDFVKYTRIPDAMLHISDFNMKYQMLGDLMYKQVLASVINDHAAAMRAAIPGPDRNTAKALVYAALSAINQTNYNEIIAHMLGVANVPPLVGPGYTEDDLLDVLPSTRGNGYGSQLHVKLHNSTLVGQIAQPIVPAALNVTHLRVTSDALRKALKFHKAFNNYLIAIADQRTGAPTNTEFQSTMKSGDPVSFNHNVSDISDCWIADGVRLINTSYMADPLHNPTIKFAPDLTTIPTNDEVELSHMFDHIIKAMSSKVLTVMNAYRVKTRPIDSKTYNSFRMITGGATEVKEEAIELYVRLLLLLEFYRDLFSWDDGNYYDKAPLIAPNPTNKDARKITLIPDIDGTFSGVFNLMFVKAKNSKHSSMSDSNLNYYISEVNAIWDKLSSKYPNGDAVRGIMQECANEVNRRYGLVKIKERDAYDKWNSSTYSYSQFNRLPQGLTEYDDNILPDEDVNDVKDSQITPSDRFVSNNTAFSSKVAPVQDTYVIDQLNYDLFYKFRCLLDSKLLNKSSNVDGDDLHKSIKLAKKNLGDKMRDDKLTAVKQLIRGSSNLTKSDNMKCLLFHETVVTGLTALNGITTLLANFRMFVLNDVYKNYYEHVDGNTKKKTVLKHVSMLMDLITPGVAGTGGVGACDITAFGASITAGQVTPGVAGNNTRTIMSNYIHAVDTVDESVIALSDNNIDPGHVGATDNSDAFKARLNGEFFTRKTLTALFEHLYMLDNDTNGLIKVNIDRSTNDSLNVSIDWSGLKDQIDKLFSSVKYFLEALKPYVSANIYRMYSDKTVVGSLYWLQEHLYERLLEGRNNVKENYEANNSDHRNFLVYTPIESLSNYINKTLHTYLNDELQNVNGVHVIRAANRLTLASVLSDLTLKVVPAYYQNWMCEPVKIGDENSVDKLLTVDIGEGNRLVNQSYMGRAVDIKSYIDNEYPLHRHNRCLVLDFNRAVLSYIDMFYDRTNHKIYKPLVEKVAMEVLNDQVLDQSITISDVARGHLTNAVGMISNQTALAAAPPNTRGSTASAVNKPTPYTAYGNLADKGWVHIPAKELLNKIAIRVASNNAYISDASKGASLINFGTNRDISNVKKILLTSVSVMLKNFFTSKTSIEAEYRLASNVGDLSSYMKETMRGNLPYFKKIFRLIADKAKYIQNIMSVSKPLVLNQVANADSAAYSTQLVTINNVPGALGPDIAIVAGRVPNRKRTLARKVLGEVFSYGEYINTADMRASPENDLDRNISLLTQVLDASNGIVASITQALHDLGDSSSYMDISNGFVDNYKNNYKKEPLILPSYCLAALQRDPVMVPKYKFGSSQFKYMYGVRSILADDGIINHDSVKGYLGQDKSYDKFLESFSKLVSFVGDVQTYKYLISVFSQFDVTRYLDVNDAQANIIAGAVPGTVINFDTTAVYRIISRASNDNAEVLYWHDSFKPNHNLMFHRTKEFVNSSINQDKNKIRDVRDNIGNMNQLSQYHGYAQNNISMETSSYNVALHENDSVNSNVYMPYRKYVLNDPAVAVSYIGCNSTDTPTINPSFGRYDNSNALRITFRLADHNELEYVVNDTIVLKNIYASNITLMTGFSIIKSDYAISTNNTFIYPAFTLTSNAIEFIVNAMSKISFIEPITEITDLYCASSQPNDVIITNIIDMNINPINVHALMRSIPLANLYNYSYTFDRYIVESLYGVGHEFSEVLMKNMCKSSSNSDASTMTIANDDFKEHNPTDININSNWSGVLSYKDNLRRKNDGYHHNTGADGYRSTKELFVALLVNPNVRLSGLPFQFLFTGESNLPFERPKYLSDQVYNKGLLQPIAQWESISYLQHKGVESASLHSPKIGSNVWINPLVRNKPNAISYIYDPLNSLVLTYMNNSSAGKIYGKSNNLNNNVFDRDRVKRASMVGIISRDNYKMITDQLLLSRAQTNPTVYKRGLDMILHQIVVSATIVQFNRLDTLLARRVMNVCNTYRSLHYSVTSTLYYNNSAIRTGLSGIAPDSTGYMGLDLVNIRANYD